MRQELVKRALSSFSKLGYKFENFIWENLRETSKIAIEKMRNMSDYEVLQTIKDGIVIDRKNQYQFPYYEKVQIIDFKNVNKNDFYILQEVHIQNCIFDSIITVNGMPLVLIEFNRDTDKGCIQLQKYLSEESLSEYLRTIQIVVSIGENGLKYKTKHRLSSWKTWNFNQVENIEEKIENFFNKETLLNIIQNYIVFIDGKNEIATYYQYWATEKIMENEERKKKIYLASGSGKTTSMLFLIEKLQNEIKKTKILILVERLVMQDILAKKIKDNLLKNVAVANTSTELETMINNTKEDIIITTIQKLYIYNGVYLGKINIIADFVTPYNENLLERLGKENFKNATLIEYTNNKENNENYLYYYSEGQAIKDGVITKIFYEEKNGVDIYNQDSIINDINKSFRNNYLKNRKAIILTQEKNSIEYIKKMAENQSIATTSIIENMNSKEFIEDIVRENESLENYKRDSIQNFNYGQLEILVVSSLEELKEITTEKVDTIYLDKEISINMLSEICTILNRKRVGKERGLIVDYAKNKNKLKEFTMQTIHQEENKEIVSDISKIINDARQLYFGLLREEKTVKRNMKTIYGLDSRIMAIEVESYLIKVKKFLERISFIFSSEDLLKLLEEREQKRYKEQIINFLDVMDQIAVVYVKEIKEKQLIKEWCRKLGINSFDFTPIQKSDLWEYPNLEGAWKKFSTVQSSEAIKNRLKIYAINTGKEQLEKLEKQYKQNQIDETQYCKEIERIRQEYVKKIRNNEIPKELKSEEFCVLLYDKIKNAICAGEIKVLSEEKLANIIIEISNLIKENIKIGWKGNIYLWKKIELKIIEEIYDRMQKGEIFISETMLDRFLIEIKNIAFQTIDISRNYIKSYVYYIKKKNAYAVAEKRETGFVVLKNSTTVEGFSKNMDIHFVKIGENLRKDGIIVNNKFVKDYEFRSPSTAANIILGRSSNGRIEWKDKNGKTIAQNEEE